MKKILFAILTALVFVSCDKDNESVFTGALKDGLYVFYGEKYTVLIGTGHKDGWSYETNCYPGYITITDMATGEYVFNQINEISYIERKEDESIFNGWAYKNGLSILCVPVSEKAFTGIVLNNSSDIELPDKMVFSFYK